MHLRFLLLNLFSLRPPPEPFELPLDRARESQAQGQAPPGAAVFTAGFVRRRRRGVWRQKRWRYGIFREQGWRQVCSAIVFGKVSNSAVTTKTFFTVILCCIYAFCFRTLAVHFLVKLLSQVSSLLSRRMRLQLFRAEGFRIFIALIFLSNFDMPWLD